jgi:hypothetical protein
MIWMQLAGEDKGAFERKGVRRDCKERAASREHRNGAQRFVGARIALEGKAVPPTMWSESFRGSLHVEKSRGRVRALMVAI